VGRAPFASFTLGLLRLGDNRYEKNGLTETLLLDAASRHGLANHVQHRADVRHCDGI
jgi:hypothetical protein